MGLNQIQHGAELNGAAKYLPRLLTAAGRPGAGKDTNANPVAEGLGYELLRTSSLLKAYAGAFPDTPDGIAVTKAMTTGKLAPDDVTANVVAPQLVTKLEVAKVMPNGFPRSKVQYDIFRRILNEQGIDDDYCLFFDIPEDLATERILAGNRGRPDDKPEVVADRMKEYDEFTRPVIDAYGEVGRLLTISITDPRETPEQVQARVRAAITAVAFSRAELLGTNIADEPLIHRQNGQHSNVVSTSLRG